MAADVARLKTDMNAARRTVEDFGKSVGSTLKGALAGLSVGFVAREFVQMSDAMTLANARLRLATSSMEEYSKAQQEVYRIAQLNRAGIVETTTLFQKLSPAVKNMGGGMQEVAAITEAFASSLRVGGASTAEAAAATLQFAQAMGSGKLAGDEFRAIAEASPRFMKAIADGMGVPVGALKEMSKEGKLTADVVGNALLKGLAQLAAEAQKIPDTVGGAMQQVKNEMMLFTQQVQEATGVSSGLAQVLGIAGQFIREIGKAVSQANVDLSVHETVILGIGEAFETVIVLGANAAYMFRTIGKEIGVIAAQINAWVHGDFEGASRMREEWIAEAEAARKEIDAFSERVVGATQRAVEHNRAQREAAAAAGATATAYVRLKNAVPTRDQLQAAEAAAKLRGDLLDQVSALERNTESTTRLSDAQKLMLKIGEALRDNKLQLKAGEAQLMMARLEAIHVTEQARDREEELLKARNESLADEMKMLATIKDAVKAQQEENAQLGLNTAQLAEYRLGKEKIVLANLRVKASTLELSEAETRAIEAQIAAQEELIAIMQAGEVKRASVESANVARDAWMDFARDIERALTDAMVQGFDNGKSVVRSIGDWIVNYFKTTIARGIAQALMGAMGAGLSSAASASGGGSMLGSLLGGGGGMFSSLLSGAGLFTGAGAFGATGLMSTLTGTGLGTSLGAAGSLMAGGNVAGGAMMGLGSIAPYLAAAYGLYRIISGVGTGRSRGPAYQEWATSGPMSNIFAGGINNPGGGSWQGGHYQAQVNAISSAVASAARSLGGAANAGTTYGLYSAQSPDGLGANTVSQVVGARGGGYYMARTGGNADIGQLFADTIPAMILAGLQDSNLPKKISEFFASANVTDQASLDRMVAMASAAHQMADAFKQLGGPFAQLQNLSVEARVAIMDLTGGLEAFVSKVQGYYGAFYSQEEQQAMSLLSAQRTLQAAGIDTSGLRSNADFRAQVEALDLSTQSGMERFAAYMNAAGAFASGSDLLASTGMTLGQITAGAPDYSAAFMPVVESQSATNSLLQNMTSVLTVISETIREGMAVRVDVNVPAAVEVFGGGGGRNEN
jgi:tape measure domain-containing protein